MFNSTYSTPFEEEEEKSLKQRWLCPVTVKSEAQKKYTCMNDSKTKWSQQMGTLRIFSVFMAACVFSSFLVNFFTSLFLWLDSFNTCLYLTQHAGGLSTCAQISCPLISFKSGIAGNLPLLIVLPPQLISIPSFCCSHCVHIVCVCACVRACVRACMRVCVRVCVRACVCVSI